jgi:hypothetical protein
LLLAAPLCLGAQTEFFPLQVGNEWIFRLAGPNAEKRFDGSAEVPVSAKILRTETFRGEVYYLTRGLAPRDLWLRMSPEGQLWARDEENLGEILLVDFSAPDGQRFASAWDACTTRGFVAGRQEERTLPFGIFSNLLRVNYLPERCADAGIAADWFLPYVGLVRREHITVAGPRVYEMVYARVGGVLVTGEPEVAFSVAMDQPVYAPASRAYARLTFRNTHEKPVELSFRTSQRFDVLVRNERGAEVYRWSADKGFLQVLGVERLTGETNFAIEFPLNDVTGQALPPGRYSLEGWITSDPVRYRAQSSFEIR